MKKAFYVVIAAIFVLMFATVANANPAPGSIGSNAVVQNAGSGDARVIVTYYNQAGSSIAFEENQTIAAGAAKEFQAADSNLPAGFVGSAVVSSDQPLAAVVSLRATGVEASSGSLTQAAYNATVSAARTIYFPSVWGFEAINTIMSIQNTESSATTATASFFDRDGNPLGTKDYSLAGNGSVTINMDDATDLPTGFDTAAFQDGSVTVVSSATNIAGAAHNAYANRAAAYQALTTQNQGTTLYAPSHFRAVASGGGFNLFSVINIQNTSTTDDAPITIEYYSRADGTLSTTVTCTIPASSAVGLNTNNGGNGCGTTGTTFESGLGSWDGSVKIISDNNIPLLGTGFTQWGNAGYAGAYALVTSSDAASKIYSPAHYRRDVSGFGWAQWSAINVQNIGSTAVSASDVTVTYVDAAGVEVASFTGSELPFTSLGAGAAFGMNTRNGGDLTADDFTALGDDFRGGIVLTGPAGSELVLVANIVYSNRASAYNGVPSSN